MPNASVTFYLDYCYSNFSTPFNYAGVEGMRVFRYPVDWSSCGLITSVYVPAVTPSILSQVSQKLVWALAHIHVWIRHLPTLLWDL